ncbi:unnamed protein product [Ascophyllum nodosum]
MDLYANLPSAKPPADANNTPTSSKASASSSSTASQGWAHSKFQEMITKRRTATAAATSRMAPPAILKRPGPSSPALRITKETAKETTDDVRPKSKSKPRSPQSKPQPPANRPKSWDMGFGDVEDDYDPARPNDYMEYCRERINKKKKEERDRELKIIMEEQERERKRQDEERAETIRKIQEAATKRHQEEAAGGVPGSPGIGAAAAGLGRGAGSIAALEESMGRGRGRGMSNLPAWMTKAKAKAPAAPDASMDDVSAREPPTPMRGLNVPGQFENASNRRAGRFGPQAGGPGAGASVGGGENSKVESGMNFAERMMAKMGHKEGQGLGASRQGISQPLQSMAAGGGMGVIDMHQADKKRMGGPGDSPAPLPPPARKKRGLFSNPTRVLLLKNMVGPGEVDDELEGETQGECERFGPVRRCIIYEMKDGDLPDTEKVRIFVAFEKQESAVKAYLEMNGRYFAGRQIAASFYKEDKFDALQLDPQPGEEKP